MLRLNEDTVLKSSLPEHNTPMDMRVLSYDVFCSDSKSETLLCTEWIGDIPRGRGLVYRRTERVRNKLRCCELGYTYLLSIGKNDLVISTTKHSPQAGFGRVRLNEIASCVSINSVDLRVHHS